jgi:hypothetical protein
VCKPEAGVIHFDQAGELIIIIPCGYGLVNIVAIGYAAALAAATQKWFFHLSTGNPKRFFLKARENSNSLCHYLQIPKYCDMMTIFKVRLKS